MRGNAAGWASAEVIGALAVGAVLAVALVRSQRRAPQPMLPMRFFRSRAFSCGNAASFLQYGALFGSVFFMAQFLQTGLGYGPLGAGVRLVPWTATLFFVAPVAGALVNRFGERPLIVAGLVLQSGGMVWLAWLASPTVAYPALVVPLIVTGCGTSMVFPATQNSVLGAVLPDEIGKASGVFSTGRELGGVFGVAIAVAVFTATGGYDSAQTFTDGFRAAFLAAALLAFLGAVAGGLLPTRHDASAEPVAVGELDNRVDELVGSCQHDGQPS
jgi:MFS family permease